MKNVEYIHSRAYPRNLINHETELAMIAERAYYKAEKRNFKPGLELEDWLQAEQEVLNQSFYWRVG